MAEAEDEPELLSGKSTGVPVPDAVEVLRRDVARCAGVVDSGGVEDGYSGGGVVQNAGFTAKCKIFGSVDNCR